MRKNQNASRVQNLMQPVAVEAPTRAEDEIAAQAEARDAQASTDQPHEEPYCPTTAEEFQEIVQNIQNQALQQVQRKVMVVYEFSKRDGTSGKKRGFLAGVADIRTERQVIEIEKMIIGDPEETGILSAQIISWQALEA